MPCSVGAFNVFKKMQYTKTIIAIKVYLYRPHPPLPRQARDIRTIVLGAIGTVISLRTNGDREQAVRNSMIIILQYTIRLWAK